MRCTGYSVIHGTDISAFDVDVLDVVDGDAVATAPRILVQVSGPAVDATGIGPGFSGSPIYCPDAAGVSRNIGAISESIGEYGGKTALATPIEHDPRHAASTCPAQAPRRATAHGRRAGGGEAPGRALPAALAAGARAIGAPLTRRGGPLTAPLAISGAAGEAASAAKAGRPVLAAPAGAARVVPGADAAAGVGGRGRATRAGTSASGRSARCPTSTATACGRSGTRSTARAGGRCCCRTPTSSAWSTTRSQLGAPRGRTSSPHRGTTSGRSASTATTRVGGRDGRAAAHRARPRARPRRGHQARTRTWTSRWPTRPPWTCRAAARGPRSVAPAGDRCRRRRRCSAARRRAPTGDMCARIDARRAQAAAALLQPLRLDRRGAGGRRQRCPTPSAPAPRRISANALADIDAYTGKPPP